MTTQEALYHGPGNDSAANLWRFRPGVRAPMVSDALRDLAAISPAHVFVGLADESVTTPALWPSWGADLFVQVAAATRVDLLDACNRVATRLASIAEFLDELLGGKIGPGLEPFGYRDGIHRPSREEIDRVARIGSGPREGGTWVLAVRFQQDLDKFGRLDPKRQDDVFGRRRDGAPVPHAPADAHTQLMRPYGSVMVRRGFPFRSWGEEGLLFVGAAADPDALTSSAARMVTGGDRLLPYAAPVASGLFFAPPVPRRP